MVVRILTGDALATLRTLESESVQCVVTSPPYMGLRSYGTEPVIRGGDPGHAHDWSAVPSTGARTNDDKPGPMQHAGNTGRTRLSSDLCACGAWRGELGLEPTPALFIAHLVEIFEEVRRVLRADGLCFVNIGDSYVSNAKGAGQENTFRPSISRVQGGYSGQDGGLKPKNLLLIPQRFAIAMQDAGWYVRSCIVWAKKSCMPESVHGSFYTRHRVKISEYERLHCMWNDAGSGSISASTTRLQAVHNGGESRLPSDRSLPSNPGTLSAEREGQGVGTRSGGTGRRAGEASVVQQFAAGQGEQGQIRGNGEGQGSSGQEVREVPGVRTWQGSHTAEGCTSEVQPGMGRTEEGHRPTLSTDTGREGRSCGGHASASRGHCRMHGFAIDGSGVAGDPEGEPLPLLLLQDQDEDDNGSRHPVEQGRGASQGERGTGVYPVQQSEEQPSDDALVDCPGCPKCAPHGGLILKRGAGRPTSSWEPIWMFAKSADYFWDDLAVQTASGASMRNVLHIGPEPNTERVKTTKRVRVALDEASGDTERIESPDCPVHALPPESRTSSTPECGGPPEVRVPGSADIATDRDLALVSCDAPMPPGYSGSSSIGSLGRTECDSWESTSSADAPQTVEPRNPHDTEGTLRIPADSSGSPRLEDSQTATRHNRAFRRTVPDLATSSPDMPFGETVGSIDDIPETPCLFGFDHDMDESSISTVDSDVRPSPDTESGTVHTSSIRHSSEPCTCSYWDEVTVSVSHYAGFPTAIPRTCILAGTSERGCCPSCGAPWVRLVERGDSTRQGPTASGWREASRRGDPSAVTRLGERQHDTTGWAPGCSCRALRCTECNLVVQYKDERQRKDRSTVSQAIPSDMRDLRGAVLREEDRSKLRADVQSQDPASDQQQSEASTGADLRELREGVYRAEADAGVQQGMHLSDQESDDHAADGRGSAEAIPLDGSGALTPCLEGRQDDRLARVCLAASPGSPDVGQERVGTGASSRDGGTHGETVGTIRERPSPERCEGRQQDRKSGDRDARTAEWRGDLPTLPTELSGSLTCWACGGAVEIVPFTPVPQTVLDPFLGSGTTLMVASRLGRNGLGIELNETYAELSRKRIADDIGPMFPDEVQVASPQASLFDGFEAAG